MRANIGAGGPPSLKLWRAGSRLSERELSSEKGRAASKTDWPQKVTKRRENEPGIIPVSEASPRPRQRSRSFYRVHGSGGAPQIFAEEPTDADWDHGMIGREKAQMTQKRTRAKADEPNRATERSDRFSLTRMRANSGAGGPPSPERFGGHSKKSQPRPNRVGASKSQRRTRPKQTEFEPQMRSGFAQIELSQQNRQIGMPARMIYSRPTEKTHTTELNHEWTRMGTNPITG